MISGKVNKELLPMIPVSVKKRDGNWMELDVLLDTGSEFGFMIAPDTFRDFYNLSSIDQIPYLGSSMSTPYEWVELKLDGNSTKEVKAEILKFNHFPGVIGPSLLLNRRIVIDIEDNGLVEIDWITRPTQPTFLTRLLRRIRKPEQQLPSLEYMWKYKLPWVNLAIKDSRDKWHHITVNVDTGNN